jgi:L,D-transpeptidase-like protein/putative peptidoglycan binding protein
MSRRGLSIFAVLCVLAAAAAPALAQQPTSPPPTSAQEPQRVPQGVSAGGVDLSGLTLEEATAQLEATLGQTLQGDLTFGVAGRPWSLTMADAKLRLDALRTAKRALRAVPPAASGDPAAPAPTVSIPVALSHSRLAVRAFVAQVARSIYRAPRDATAQIGLRRVAVKRSRKGHDLDRVKAEQLINTALDDVTAPRVVHQRVRSLRPKVTYRELLRTYGTVVTVDRATFTLRLFKRLRVVKRYSIAVGAAGFDTPSGVYRISSRQVNPAWHAPDKPWAGQYAGQTIAPGAWNNPLKSRWLGIANGVGIHGTAENWSIGSRASHGCIRMHVWDVEALYPRVPLGTPVLIR